MIYDIVDMTTWRTKTDILKELKSKGVEMSERAFRKLVGNINKLYREHENDIYIAHSNRGYKATKDTTEIKASESDNRKRAINMLVNSAQTLKAIGENANLSLKIQNGEMIYTEV